MKCREYVEICKKGEAVPVCQMAFLYNGCEVVIGKPEILSDEVVSEDITGIEVVCAMILGLGGLGFWFVIKQKNKIVYHTFLLLASKSHEVWIHSSWLAFGDCGHLK